MNRVKYLIYCLLIFYLFVNTTSKAEEYLCNSEIIQTINNQDEIRSYEYNELRDDIGIHYDFTYDKEKNSIKIKRKKGYPIVRLSLYEKQKINAGETYVKKYNDQDLSKISDAEIIKLHRKSDIAILTLDDDQKIKLLPKPYHLNDFKLSNFKIKSIHDIDTTKGILEISFNSNIENSRSDFLKVFSDQKNLLDDGIHNICDDFRNNNSFPIESVNFDEFKYDADVREGLNNKEKLVSSVFDLIYDYENDEIRTIRTEKGVAYFRQSFDFKKFPFDTQKLIINIKSGQVNQQYENHKNSNTEGSITFLTPEVGVYLSLLKYIETNKLKAWKIPDGGIEIISKEVVDNNFFDKWTKKIIQRSENILSLEITIERNYQHYLLKIMLPVFLILCVAWYVLWIPTFKYEARLNTSIIALLALIAYNFVFQDDIPKLEYLTDLDWFILLSYIFCCIPVFLSIGFSKFISKNQTAVTKLNKFIRTWGGILYLLLILQIFYR